MLVVPALLTQPAFELRQEMRVGNRRGCRPKAGQQHVERKAVGAVDERQPVVALLATGSLAVGSPALLSPIRRPNVLARLSLIP